MPKYKIGDIVKVKSLDQLKEAGEEVEGSIRFKGCTVAFNLEQMGQFCGQLVKIVGVDSGNDSYYIQEDNASNTWKDWMFNQDFLLRPGNFASFSNDGRKWVRRIFLDYISGAKYPFAVVSPRYEDAYLKGQDFLVEHWALATNDLISAIKDNTLTGSHNSSIEPWKQRYRADYYLHRLAIEHHIIECYFKLKRILSKDGCPFKAQSFLKELADLYILLDLYKEFYQDFSALVSDRENAFRRKFEEMKNSRS